MAADGTGEGAEAVVVLTTLAGEDAAAAFVGALLERRLVACGTILPGARSLYRREGRVADEREAVVLLKTTGERVPALRDAFGALHPYRTPELLVFPAHSGAPAYLAWVVGEVTSRSSV